MGYHFQCTACGRCCYGEVPLTLSDAMAHAGTFPLAMVWTLVPARASVFPLIEKLGTVIRVGHRTDIAILVAPTAYLSAKEPCPYLQDDHLCSIHDSKPLRCQSMPFYPYRWESDQADLLKPRDGWACDVSSDAPLVYEDKTIIDRYAFDRERTALLGDAPRLAHYAQRMLKQQVPLMKFIQRAIPNQQTRCVVKFSSFLSMNKEMDIVDFAHKQYPVLQCYADKTHGVPEARDYHRYYTEAAADLAWFIKKRS